MRKRMEASDRNAKDVESAEPVGIVISNGTRHEDVPRFAAYVWGPVPASELAEEPAAELVAVA